MHVIISWYHIWVKREKKDYHLNCHIIVWFKIMKWFYSRKLWIAKGRFIMINILFLKCPSPSSTQHIQTHIFSSCSNWFIYFFIHQFVERIYWCMSESKGIIIIFWKKFSSSNDSQNKYLWLYMFYIFKCMCMRLCDNISSNDSCMCVNIMWCQ